MSIRKAAIGLTFGTAIWTVAVTAMAQVPARPPASVWSFLGIPQAYKHVHDNTFNRTGKHPGLERKPPLAPIGALENLESPNPAIKKAAEIKQQEDLKKQKIKAVKYLAAIGCGCYNRDGSITDAMIKAMDDCTEEVRYETILAITEVANEEMCENCQLRSCCSEEISNKLYELAYERDETGCFLEPSERVRLAAAEALRSCCPGTDDGFMVLEGQPYLEPRQPGGERPGVDPLRGGERPGDAFPEAPLEAVPPPDPVPTPASEPTATRPRSSRRTATMYGRWPAPSASTRVARPSEKTVAVGPPVALEDQHLPAAPLLERQVNYTKPAMSSVEQTQDESPTQTLAPLVRLPPVSAPPVKVVAPVVSAKSSGTLAPIVPASAATPTRYPEAAPAPVTSAVVETKAAPASLFPLPPVPTVVAAKPVRVTAASRGSSRSALRPFPKAVETRASARNTAERKLPGAEFGTGVVTSVRMRDGLAFLEFQDNATVPPGSVLRAYHEYALANRKAICDLEVVRTQPGAAIARPRAGSQIGELSVGDQAIVLR
ncbi:MAG: hypothetical protein WD872_19360 [Pirellulaceae bacterium]